MTSRTIDCHCDGCRKYLFSLQPDCTSAELTRLNFCNKKCENGYKKPDLAENKHKSAITDAWLSSQ